MKWIKIHTQLYNHTTTITKPTLMHRLNSCDCCSDLKMIRQLLHRFVDL